MSQFPSPEIVRDNSDRGDDIQRRFRYQNTYTAILALSLIKENSEYDCLFCEFQEDILIKQKSGKFIGIQVKTKDDGDFGSNEKSIRDALKKFVKLEEKFSDHFSKYLIVTNRPVQKIGITI